MKRTTIMLPEDVDTRLRLEARRRRVSIADVVRVAVEQHLPRPPASHRLGFFSVGQGRPADASDRVDELVGGAVARRRRVRRSA
ncbi:MAG: ribbon-helix-helix protein, CopG family [Candidatus Dormibacteria bacterium]